MYEHNTTAYRTRPIGHVWDRNLKASTRRSRVLKAQYGDMAAAGRACNQLANASKDKRVVRTARADAKYFFRQNEKIGRTLKFVD